MVHLSVESVRSRRHPRKNPIVQEYVLPDYSARSTSRTGYIRSGPDAAQPESVQDGKKAIDGNDEEDQVLWMGNERFTGSELLFNPSDIGK